MSRVSTPQQYVVLQGYHLGESEKAVKFKVIQVAGQDIEEPKTEWFPFSQMKSQSYNKIPGSNEFDTIEVSKWICEQKNLEV